MFPGNTYISVNRILPEEIGRKVLAENLVELHFSECTICKT